ncbi:BPSL0761 family protein [Xanthomonas sacchari]|uniref:BPSL0761 family protein n=1 Tax=Xanthomonas sacchari TaxID=56458 RepID=UPI0012E018E0|nr:BPSL0761 family protein [Xanthomonas sacchari]
MTTTVETIRHITQAGAFLVELALNEDLPREVRREACRLVRHYPTLGMAKQLARILGVDEQIPDPSWLTGYEHGPLTESLSDRLSRLTYNSQD